MAWGGKYGGRMTLKQRSHFFRSANRSLPPRENPNGVPRAVMKALSQAGLSSDPAAFNLRLQQLLSLHELNKGE
jgi:hypothetical protein